MPPRGAGSNPPSQRAITSHAIISYCCWRTPPPFSTSASAADAHPSALAQPCRPPHTPTPHARAHARVVAARARVCSTNAPQVCNGYRPPLNKVLTHAQWDLICRCWHDDPIQRPSMAEVADELKLLLQVRGGGPVA